MPVFRDGELIDRHPVVGFHIVEVDYLRLHPTDRTVVGPVFDCHAVHQYSVESAVARFEGCALWEGQLAEGVVEGIEG